VAVVITNYIEELLEKYVEFFSDSGVVRVFVCVSNRQDVCRSGCSGNVKKKPNNFEPQSEVNILQFTVMMRLLLSESVSVFEDVPFGD
jgi:hypothetical protein